MPVLHLLYAPFKGAVRRVLPVCFLLALLLALCPGRVAAQDLGKGFFDHGVASPISNHRGTVATVDGEGKNVVLVWLFDYRGGYALLMIDAATGRSEQFAMPFAPGKDTPYASVLSSQNKFYTLFNGNFAEFDPVKRAFTFHKSTMPRMAMAMTEDDQGRIWAVTYPNSGVVSFDPKTRELKDYGYVHKENWYQYQRTMAPDDSGWIYFALGNTATQLVAFDPATGKSRAILPEGARRRGMAHLYRDQNGKVYGQALADKKEPWYEMHRGQARQVPAPTAAAPKPIITGSQTLFHAVFPDGKRLKACNLTDKVLVVEDPKTKTSKEVKFDYTSEGAWVMGVGASPDGTIIGGTSFPMRQFGFDPKTNTWVNRPAHGQFNALVRQGQQIFFGVYPGASLVEWDAAKPWVATDRRKTGTNPQFHTHVTPVIHRPHRLLALPDGNTIVMSGTPEYGYTGGGMLFWDRAAKKQTLLADTDLIADQSTMSMVALPKGQLLGGTTTAPGTGGEKKAQQAELYLLDLATKKVSWRQVVFPGVQEYSDLCLGPKNLVFGMADKKRFFVFDTKKRRVVHEENVAGTFGAATAEQSPRIFVTGPEKEIYVLFVKGIARLDPRTFQLSWVAQSPVPIHAGGDYLDGRIYFVSGSHVCSYTLPLAGERAARK
ncbi:MAG: hypothetical protein ACO1O1_03655 [Adhaeribacter sp.]